MCACVCICVYALQPLGDTPFAVNCRCARGPSQKPTFKHSLFYFYLLTIPLPFAIVFYFQYNATRHAEHFLFVLPYAQYNTNEQQK